MYEIFKEKYKGIDKKGFDKICQSHFFKNNIEKHYTFKYYKENNWEFPIDIFFKKYGISTVFEAVKFGCVDINNTINILKKHIRFTFTYFAYHMSKKELNSIVYNSIVKFINLGFNILIFEDIFYFLLNLELYFCTEKLILFIEEKFNGKTVRKLLSYYNKNCFSRDPKDVLSLCFRIFTDKEVDLLKLILAYKPKIRKNICYYNYFNEYTKKLVKISLMNIHYMDSELIKTTEEHIDLVKKWYVRNVPSLKLLTLENLQKQTYYSHKDLYDKLLDCKKIKKGFPKLLLKYPIFEQEYRKKK
jgi:hypothetical protein